MTRAALLVLLLAFAPATPAAASEACRAVDGDTIRCGEERVRLAGIDAPELRGACAEERALARQARRRLDGLLARGPVELERLARRDRFRRTLAVARDADGHDLGAVLVAEGLARPYPGRGRRAGWCG